MRTSFDRRVVQPAALEFIRACQRRVPCHLGGGAALSGAVLAHRLSNDIDLFVHDREEHRDLVSLLPEIARQLGCGVVLRRGAESHLRATLELPERSLELDVVHDMLPDLEPPPAPIEGVVVESLTDLRASKLTCLLSRSEPRDLVDVLFLERAGYSPEADFELALRKDSGMDPGVLAWLLNEFPVEPMPMMLVDLQIAELDAYRRHLAERFRRLATGG
jgi:hypothetical protein